jgi:hypothetical protein
MAFITVEAGHSARERLQNTVKCRSSGGGVSFTVARDVADKIGLVPGGRVRIAVGIGSDEGRVAVYPASDSEPGTYRISHSGKMSASCSLSVGIGVRHVGWERATEFGSTSLRFSATPGCLIAELPMVAGIVRASRNIPISTNGMAAQAA